MRDKSKQMVKAERMGSRILPYRGEPIEEIGAIGWKKISSRTSDQNTGTYTLHLERCVHCG
jgi:hypothetical protein